MKFLDKQLNETLKERLRSMHGIIDSYIAARYRPPYTEHDIGLEECNEDNILETSRAGSVRHRATFKGKTFSSAVGGTPPFSDASTIDDFLKQQSETLTCLLVEVGIHIGIRILHAEFLLNVGHPWHERLQFLMRMCFAEIRKLQQHMLEIGKGLNTVRFGTFHHGNADFHILINFWRYSNFFKEEFTER